MLQRFYSRSLRSERGDTNFISILIILGIVIALATTFILFKNQVLEGVKSIIDNFNINSTATST